MQVSYTEGLKVLEPHERDDIARLRDMLNRTEGLILPGIIVGNGRQSVEVDALFLFSDFAVAIELKSCSGVEVTIPSAMAPMRFRYARGEIREFDNPVPWIEKKSKIIGTILGEIASGQPRLFCHPALVFSAGTHKSHLKLSLGPNLGHTRICLLPDFPRMLETIRRERQWPRPLPLKQLHAVATAVLGTSEKEPHDCPKTVGNYALQDKLRSFSVGDASCFAGEEIGTGLRVLLLRLPRDVFQELPDQIQVAFRDAVVLSRLAGKPNIARYRGYVEYREYAYIVVDREKGVFLDQWLEEQVAAEAINLDWLRVRFRILRGILDGLRSLQSEGITWRDLRAENVFLTETLEPRLFHFEAAKLPGAVTIPDRLRRHLKHDYDDLDAWARLAQKILSRRSSAKDERKWHSDLIAIAPDQQEAQKLIELIEQLPKLQDPSRPRIDAIISCLDRCATPRLKEQSPMKKKARTDDSEVFQPTRWTKLRGALEKARVGTAPRNNPDLEFLLHMYDKPIIATLKRLERRYTGMMRRAEDLKQEFLERNFVANPEWLAKPDKERGRFRDFLAVALRNFLLNELKASSRKTKGPTEGAKQFPSVNDPEAETPESMIPSAEQIETELSHERALAIFSEASARLREWAGTETDTELVAQVDAFLSRGVHKSRFKSRFDELLRKGVREEIASSNEGDLDSAMGREIKLLLMAL